jgi:hypothetical protein
VLNECIFTNIGPLDRLCGLVVRVLVADPEVLGSISVAITFSEK